MEANDPRDRERDDERQEALRKRIFAFADTGKVDFDDLLCFGLGEHVESLMREVPSETQGMKGASSATRESS